MNDGLANYLSSNVNPQKIEGIYVIYLYKFIS